MSDDRFYRIDEEDIEELRDRLEYHNPFPGREYVQEAVAWLKELPELDDALRELEEAFAGVKLEDGTGLWEAQGIDDYACEEELAKLCERDEKEDWRRIKHEDLNRCYSSPTFMNAKGYVFHLPAFLMAELNDNYSFGFLEELTRSLNFPEGWVELLNGAQRKALARVVTVASRHPGHIERRDAFDAASTYLLDNKR